MKTKIKNIIAGLSLLISSGSFSQQVVDISTGVNSSSSLINVGVNDDSWTVEIPSSSYFQPAICSNGSVYEQSTGHVLTNVWQVPTCGRWISPFTITSGAGTGSVASGATTNTYFGVYTYRMSFTAKPCPVSSATMILNMVGADNYVFCFTLNGHTITLPSSPAFNPLSSGWSIAVPTSDFVSGTNILEATVVNNNWYTGFMVCGHLDINYGTDPNLIPAISGATNFCSGTPLAFTGSSGTSVATNTYWEITPSDASGNPTGPSIWNSWFIGTPGSFTFPSGLTLPCGNYYKIKLAVQNQCTTWAETSKVIYIYCLPGANAGPDVTVCNGSCVTIGTYIGMIKFTTFNWSNSSGYVGSGQQISVCPTTTTTYTLTVTNTLTGCSSTDQVVVNVESNKPDFNYSGNINPGDNFYTINATPVNTTVSGIAGFGFSWIVEEIVSITNATVISGSQVVNSGCWWGGLNCNFNGYNGPSFTSSGTNPMAGGCGSPAVGEFTVGHTYRITRGTWSTACPWHQYSIIVYMGHGMSGPGAILSQEDNTAPDYSSLVNTTTTGISDVAVENNVSVYPNPSNGVFSVELSKAAIGTIEVYNAVGERVQKLDVQDNASIYKLDLSGYSKGIYLLNFISNDQKISKKLIVQ